MAESHSEDLGDHRHKSILLVLTIQLLRYPILTHTHFYGDFDGIEPEASTNNRSFMGWRDAEVEEWSFYRHPLGLPRLGMVGLQHLYCKFMVMTGGWFA